MNAIEGYREFPKPYEERMTDLPDDSHSRTWVFCNSVGNHKTCTRALGHTGPHAHHVRWGPAGVDAEWFGGDR